MRKITYGQRVCLVLAVLVGLAAVCGLMAVGLFTSELVKFAR